MEDENLYQEGYFAAFAQTINGLDTKAADFDFQVANLRNALATSGLLKAEEKGRLRQMLHIVQLQSKPV